MAANEAEIKLRNPITTEAEGKLIAHINSLINTRTNLGIIRQKFLQCDAIVSREPNPNKPEEKRPLVAVPIVSPQIDTMVAYLTKTFLSSDSVFPVTTSPDFDNLADVVNTLFSSYARDWQWKRNLILAFKDAAKYNFMFAEATWDTVKVGTLQSTAQQIATGTNKKATQTVKQGFKLKHLDPYNTFYDIAVLPSQLAADGEFAGYFEVMNKIQLHRMLLSLPNPSGYQHRITEILKCSPMTRNFYTPSLLRYPVGKECGETVDWNKHFENVLNIGGGTQEAKEVCTIYMRIVPNDFGMRGVPQGGTPQLWKFVVVNYKYIVYAECRTNAHDYLPIVVGQPYESNLAVQQKALPEELAPLQGMASHLWSTEVASNQRTVSNREVYNPLLIEEKHINNPNPAAKIPLRNTAVNHEISKAIYSVPFNDPAAGTRTQLATGITNFASTVSGQNQVSAGQFIKGNKTDGQFQEVLNRSDARQTILSILLEDQFFGVVRHILLYDFMQYQDSTKVYDPVTKTSVEYDPSGIQDGDINFTINDALSLSANSIDPATLQVALQAVGSNQQLSAQFNTGKLFTHLLSVQGVKNLDQFLVTDNTAGITGATPNQVAAQTQPQVPGQAPQPGSNTGGLPVQGTQQQNTLPIGQQPPVSSPIDEQQFSQNMQQSLGTGGQSNGS